jgi:hypothetical protein
MLRGRELIMIYDKKTVAIINPIIDCNFDILGVRYAVIP